MVTKAKAKAKAQAHGKREFRIPTNLPKVPGHNRKWVEAQYREMVLGPKGDGDGVGHVRALIRLNKIARGEKVPAMSELGKFTHPVQPR